MSRSTLSKLAPLSLGILMILIFTLGSSEPRPLGAPWLSVEMPANPLDPETRDAAFVVRAYYHEQPAGIPITGKAEGLVDGERRSIPLEFARTSRGSTYAVKQTWPSEGHWLVAISTDGTRSGASLMIELGPEGGVSQTRYYGWPVGSLALRSVQVVPGVVDDARIDHALQVMARASD